MTSTTTNYNLTLYDSVTDAGELFLDYRTDMAGTTGSNMTKLDAALTAIQVSIDALELSKGATFVNASFDSGSLFIATGISGITAYDTNLKIILQLDQDSDGTVTLNINSLGVKSVYGINNAGTATNLVGAHLKNNREYYLRYNGTVWIVVSDTENPSVWTKNTETLSTTKTLTDYSESTQYLDPDGAHRDVELPAEADSNPIFYIVNEAGAAFNLVVKDDSPATILTLNQNETGLFISDGVTWKGFLIEDANTYLQSDGSVALAGAWDMGSQALTNVNINGSEIGSDTSFPGSPSAGDRLFRTDLGFECYYDGTDWLTVQEYFVHIPEADYTVTTNSELTWIGDEYRPKFHRVEWNAYIDTTNDGSNYWTLNAQSWNLIQGAPANVIETVDTSADSPDTWLDKGLVVSTLPKPTKYGNVKLQVVKTLTPGTLSASASIYYRKIVT